MLLVPQGRAFATTSIAPKVSQQSDSIRIRHREYWWSSAGGIGSNFNIWQPNGAPPRINPANDFIFPWLSNIAQCYERYTFHKLTFGYLPKVGTTTAGGVLMAIDSDPLDSVPNTEIVMLSYKSVVNGPVWAELKTTMTEKDLHGSYTKKYTSSSPSSDPRATDVGMFLFYCDAATQTGRFYVEYDVSLYTPQLPPQGVAGSGIVADVNPTTTEMFGVTPSIASLGINIIKDVYANKFKLDGLNVGDVLNVVWNYTNAGAANVVMGSLNTVSGLTRLNGSGASTVVPSGSGSVTNQYQVTMPTASIEILTPSGQTTAPTHSNLLLSRVPYSSNIW